MGKQKEEGERGKNGGEGRGERLRERESEREGGRKIETENENIRMTAILRDP